MSQQQTPLKMARYDWTRGNRIIQRKKTKTKQQPLLTTRTNTNKLKQTLFLSNRVPRVPAEALATIHWKKLFLEIHFRNIVFI